MRRLFFALVLLLPGCTFDGSGPSYVASTQDVIIHLADGGPHDTPRTDSAKDGPTGDTSPPSETTRPKESGVDVLSADLSVDGWPDTTVDTLEPGELLDEDFSQGFGPLSAQSGTWLQEADGIRQSTHSVGPDYALFDISYRNISAETSLTIHSVRNVSGDVPVAALLFRVTPETSTSQAMLDGCYLTPQGGGRLGIFSCEGSSFYCYASRSVTASVQLGARYLLRGKAMNNTISCELPDQGIGIQGDTTQTRGGVGVGTFYTDATFHTLRVWEQP